MADKDQKAKEKEEEAKKLANEAEIKEREEILKNVKLMSNKEIYRILAFEFRQKNGIKLSIIADLVSSIFYPFDDTVFKDNFKNDIMGAFKDYAEVNGEISEEKFCEVMEKIDKYIRAENYERFVYKIFKRHDKDKDDNLSKPEFFALMKNFKDPNLTEKDMEDIYMRMIESTKDSKSGIDYNAFLRHSIN
jgi:Ca2+-binding EF-hand superfamily protein